jgi:hypothetical protein
VATNMSVEADLQRSSWKAEAIRRGDLKISGPIPITEDMPLNEEEEQEFAEKNKAEVTPLPQDTTVERDQPQQPQAPVDAPPTVPEEPPQKAAQPDQRPQTRGNQPELPRRKSASPLPPSRSRTAPRVLIPPDQIVPQTRRQRRSGRAACEMLSARCLGRRVGMSRWMKSQNQYIVGIVTTQA